MGPPCGASELPDSMSYSGSSDVDIKLGPADKRLSSLLLNITCRPSGSRQRYHGIKTIGNFEASGVITLALVSRKCKKKPPLDITDILI